MIAGSGIFFRSFAVGAIWFAIVAARMAFQHSDRWSTHPGRTMAILVFVWVLTALLLGVAAKQFQKLRSWWTLGLATIIGSVIVLQLMLFALQKFSGQASVPKFKSTDEMMTYFANDVTRWVKTDRGLDLDFSVESIKIVEEELGRISKDVDKTHPKEGTFGIALGYGAYIGEVFRRREGGSWAVDHPVGGSRSYPFTTKTNGVIFPVSWCWKRLTSGEEDNVYHKAMVFADLDNVMTNGSLLRSQTNQ